MSVGFVVGCLQVATASLNQAWRQEEAPSSKQQRLGFRISHLDMSWLGCVLVATDTQGQLYLYRLLPISEPGTQHCCQSSLVLRCTVCVCLQ